MDTPRFKYPRTPHLPWSQGSTSDDISLNSTDHFVGKEVVVTEKLDGENTSIYTDYLHARSICSRSHVSREWVKGLHAKISHEIPNGWRICGENVFARHSVPYKNLESYFYIFSIWNENNICLTWDQTLEWACLLNIPTPREFYRGPWDVGKISSLTVDTASCEGYVVRTTEEFSYDDFHRHIAKWVRKGHVGTDEHWMNQEMVRNTLSKINNEKNN
jgi:hypothetical protein